MMYKNTYVTVLNKTFNVGLYILENTPPPLGKVENMRNGGIGGEIYELKKKDPNQF